MRGCRVEPSHALWRQLLAGHFVVTSTRGVGCLRSEEQTPSSMPIALVAERTTRETGHNLNPFKCSYKRCFNKVAFGGESAYVPRAWLWRTKCA